MKRRIAGTDIELVKGDITSLDVDAIVNAANSALAGGGGVDGAIHRAGGPEIMKQCRAIGHCSCGDAVITTAGSMKARYVIHTVGPVWHGGDQNEPDLLASAFESSLALADENSCLTMAFPAISTGVYAYPMDLACRTSLGTVRKYVEHGTKIRKIIFVLHDQAAFVTWAGLLPGVFDDRSQQ